MAENKSQDRRVQKTQTLLREALFGLVHENDYDSIVVKQILDRANVGRSTFYTHFRNKDELLVSGMREMLHSIQSARRPSSTRPCDAILWFSLPIFEHVHQYRLAGTTARMGTRGRALIHERLHLVLVELIGDDVRKAFQDRRTKAGQIPPSLFAPYVSATFLLALNWWVESGSPLSPAEVNDLFHSMILPTLTAALN